MEGGHHPHHPHPSSSTDREIFDVTVVPQSTAYPESVRTRFSDEDDEYLADWVSRAEAEGGHVNQTVYQDLAKINPRHSTTSWYQRYHVKNMRSERRTLEPITTSTPAAPPPPKTQQPPPTLLDVLAPLSGATGDPRIHPDQRRRMDEVEKQIRSLAVGRPRESPNLVANNTEALDEHAGNWSEPVLRRELECANEADFMRWLTQPWFIAIYHEYAKVMLDPVIDEAGSRGNDSAIWKHVMAPRNYVVGNVTSILMNEPTRFDNPSSCVGWTRDEHDLRFIIRLIRAGTQPARCWSNRIDTDNMCITGYRLLGWLRHIHFYSADPSIVYAKKARSVNFVTSLKRMRATLEVTRSPPTIVATPIPVDLMQYIIPVNADGTAASLLDIPPSGIEMPGVPSPTSPIQREEVIEPIAADYNTRYKVFKLPAYIAKVSANTANQLHGFEWLTPHGRARYLTLQSLMLSKWGVTPDHKASCVLIPADWENLIPLETPLMDVKYPARGHRLRFSMYDHNTSWARASSWFNGVWPHTGAEFDQFMALGPWQRMEGSHLCHHRHCMANGHVIYEEASENASRRSCHEEASNLRHKASTSGAAFPAECGKHTPGCLMHYASLTTAERVAIQHWFLHQANGSPDLFQPPPRPDDHPFPTFEYRFPLSFMDPDHVGRVISLVNPRTGTLARRVTEGPVTRCAFCTSGPGFKTISRFWSHLLELHGAVSGEEKLREIKATTPAWKSHMELQRAAGSSGGPHNRTWLRLQQVERDDFSWKDFELWRLRPEEMGA